VPSYCAPSTAARPLQQEGQTGQDEPIWPFLVVAGGLS
jgi:hypothetical protein